jgi:hypothetical protein
MRRLAAGSAAIDGCAALDGSVIKSVYVHTEHWQQGTIGGFESARSNRVTNKAATRHQRSSPQTPETAQRHGYLTKRNYHVHTIAGFVGRESPESCDFALNFVAGPPCRPLARW